MEAKELMIGDWVLFHDSGYASDDTVWKKDRVCQIDSIDTDVRVKWYDEDGCEEEWPNVSVMHLSPIPLSPEILEKNGWVKNLYSDESYFNEELECLPLVVGVDGNKWWWHVGAELVTPINYVHELQHALRLCGIGKEMLNVVLDKDSVEYICTDAFIEKACVKLKKLMYDNLMFQGRLHRKEVIDNFVEDFKKYMKGE